jgi:hypothetical protein
MPRQDLDPAVDEVWRAQGRCGAKLDDDVRPERLVAGEPRQGVLNHREIRCVIGG